MYEVTAKRNFSSAHNLRGYQGECENLHGHNWGVEVTVAAETLDELGMVIDFKALKKAMDDVLARLDHAYLNEVPPFDEINPSCENMAHYICDAVSEKIDDDRVRVSRCRVWESEGSYSTYTP